ncbi:MAG: peroxiredoxin family protein [Anaerolineae bacterium]|jgi:peroxiredoxin|nr:peroxiredoxin family protein [Anaerolineae bacterium]
MTEEYGLPVGATLPTFSAQDDQNNTHNLDDLMGENGLILAFVYGTWCATCVEALHALTRYAPQLQKEGVNIAAVLIDDTADIHNFRRSSPRPIHFPLLADKDERIHHTYRANSSKVYMVIDREYVLRHKFIDFDGTQKPNLPTLLAAIKDMASVKDN